MDAVGVVGMLMLLGAFLLNLMGRLSPVSLSYQVANALGAALLALYSIYLEVWIFAVLEGVWGSVALIRLLRSLRDPRARQHRGRS
jgi:hypothetical protein